MQAVLVKNAWRGPQARRLFSRLRGRRLVLRRPCRRAPEPREPRLEVALQILDILEPDMQPQRRACRAPFGGGAERGAVEGGDEALVAAPGGADAEELEVIDHGRDRLL